ncbi:MAG: glycosyltransferase family A protein [Alphaproteobacteria bacterium]
MSETDTNTPTVSVVMPCFNGAAYVAEAMESILAQGHPSLEIVFVDDGCTDDSVAVARRVEPSLRVLRQDNAGIAAARNAGIAAARGTYLAFLDADDLWTEGSLEVRIEALEAMSAPGYVFGGVEQFYSQELSAEQRRRFVVGQGQTDGRLVGNMLVRRADFERVGGFQEGLRVGEMIEWLARAEANGLVMHSIEPVVLRRRVHGANTTLRQTGSINRSYLQALKAGLDHRRGGTRG